MDKTAADKKAIDEFAMAEKLAEKLDLADAGYIYFHLVDLHEEYRDKYPGHKLLCLPGLEDIAVLPDGTTDTPLNVFADDYPSCRAIMHHGVGGCG